jgi:hypothetical protein
MPMWCANAFQASSATEGDLVGSLDVGRFIDPDITS